MLVVVFLFLLNSFALVWKRRSLRWALFALCAGVAGFLLLPLGPEKDRAPLRELYSKAMIAYTGSPYVWGGEGRLGIDCSGLVRRGLEDALVEHGLLTLNPYWIRKGIFIWWHDTTAQALGDGTAGVTHKLTECQSLNRLAPALIRPGDLAVSPRGIHVMAYLGNGAWIGADPTEARVTKFTIPEKKNGYFSIPMTIVRWNMLE
jgi:cell wall-associated NlpC family hydrolase